LQIYDYSSAPIVMYNETDKRGVIKPFCHQSKRLLAQLVFHVHRTRDVTLITTIVPCVRAIGSEPRELMEM
jgi:hypothetical protein